MPPCRGFFPWKINVVNKKVNKKEIYIIILVAFDAKSCVLAKQRGAVTTSGCTEKIPCSWVRQDRKNIHIVAIVLYYNSGCHERVGACNRCCRTGPLE